MSTEKWTREKKERLVFQPSCLRGSDSFLGGIFGTNQDWCYWFSVSETNIAHENWWLEDDPFFLGLGSKWTTLSKPTLLLVKPPKTNMVGWKVPNFNRKHIDSNGGFLSFRGGCINEVFVHVWGSGKPEPTAPASKPMLMGGDSWRLHVCIVC